MYSKMDTVIADIKFEALHIEGLIVTLDSLIHYLDQTSAANEQAHLYNKTVRGSIGNVYLKLCVIYLVA